MKNVGQECNEVVCLELLRVSTPKQVELGGLESQHEDCVRIAERNRVKLHPQQIRLAGISGKNVKLTPEIEHLTALLKTGNFAGVVMVEDTRLMRPDQPEDYALLQVFADTGAKIYTATMVHDLSTPEGKMLVQILFAIAGREREVIRRRTLGKREKLRARGLCASAPNTLPPGITRVRFRDGDADRWAYDYDAKISAVRRLFDDFINGETNFRTLARSSGIHFHQVPITLSNTAYIGYRTYDKRVDPKLDVLDKVTQALKYSVKVKRPENEIERVPMLGADGKPLQPAVLPEVFARAQDLLRLKREMTWQRNNSEPEQFTYRGFLRCAHCGQRLLCIQHRAKAGGPVRDYYVCKAAYYAERAWCDLPRCNAPRMRRQVIEPMLEDLVISKLGEPDFLYNLMQSQRRALMRDDNKSQIENAKKEISALEGEQDRLNILFRKGRIDENELDRESARLDAALQSARKHLSRLVPSIPQISPEMLAEVIAPFDRWDLLRTDDRRALLKAVCPLFDVRSTGIGGRGGAARTMVQVAGFWLQLGAGDNRASNKRGELAIMPETLVNTGSNQLVNDGVRC
jgi:DNA invertase Pin-like site-specific DNA recombinase